MTDEELTRLEASMNAVSALAALPALIASVRRQRAVLAAIVSLIEQRHTGTYIDVMEIIREATQ